MMNSHSGFSNSTFNSSWNVTAIRLKRPPHDAFLPLDFTQPWVYYDFGGSDFGGSRNLAFAADGCRVSQSYYNCSYSCLEPKYAFQDVQTMRNCLMYPVISATLEEEKLSQAQIEFVEGYGFLKASLVDLSKIQDIIFTCFNAAIKQSLDCENWYLTQDIEVYITIR